MNIITVHIYIIPYVNLFYLHFFPLCYNICPTHTHTHPARQTNACGWGIGIHTCDVERLRELESCYGQRED